MKRVVGLVLLSFLLASCGNGSSIVDSSFSTSNGSASSSEASPYDRSLSDMVLQAGDLAGDERMAAGAIIEGRLRNEGYIKPIAHRRVKALTRLLHAKEDFVPVFDYGDAVAVNEPIAQGNLDGFLDSDISSRDELKAYLTKKNYTLKESVVVGTYYSDPSELLKDVRYYGGSEIFPATMNRGLFTQDRKGRLYGDLASSVRVLSKTEMEIGLSEGIWHNGNGERVKDVTAENFLDAYAYIRPYLDQKYPFITDISVKDGKTLLVTVNSNVAAVPSILFETMNYPFFAPPDPTGQESGELLYCGHYSYRIVDGRFLLTALKGDVAPRIEICGETSPEAFLAGDVDFVWNPKMEESYSSILIPWQTTYAAAMNPRCEGGDEHFKQAIGNVHFRRAIMAALSRNDLVSAADPNGIPTSSLSKEQDWKAPRDIPLFGVIAQEGKGYHEISDRYAEENEGGSYVLQELEKAKAELGEAFFASPVLLPLCWVDWNAGFATAVIDALKTFPNGMIEVARQETSRDYASNDYITSHSFVYLLEAASQEPILLEAKLVKNISPAE